MTGTAPRDAILQVEALSFSYPARHVVTHWSAELGAGITWLRGSNGTGKSTLLKLMAGALNPAAGRLVIRATHEIDASSHPLDYRREVFWCGPGAIAFDHLRPAEYFGFLRGLYPRLNVEQLAAHVDGLGLAPHMQLRLNALSTGMQRKVWLSAALAVGSTVVLLDEPLNALDAASLAYVRRQLMACAADANHAWVVASHEPLGEAGEHAVIIDLDANPAT